MTSTQARPAMQRRRRLLGGAYERRVEFGASCSNHRPDSVVVGPPSGGRSVFLRWLLQGLLKLNRPDAVAVVARVVDREDAERAARLADAGAMISALGWAERLRLSGHPRPLPRQRPRDRLATRPGIPSDPLRRRPRMSPVRSPRRHRVRSGARHSGRAHGAQSRVQAKPWVRQFGCASRKSAEGDAAVHPPKPILAVAPLHVTPQERDAANEGAGANDVGCGTLRQSQPDPPALLLRSQGSFSS
jgi:hypothetical protein